MKDTKETMTNRYSRTVIHMNSHRHVSMHRAYTGVHMNSHRFVSMQRPYMDVHMNSQRHVSMNRAYIGLKEVGFQHFKEEVGMIFHPLTEKLSPLTTICKGKNVFLQ